MIELSKTKVKAVNGEDVYITVYNSDVKYSKSETYRNPTFYFDNDGKRKKTAPYCQYTAMTNRTLEGGQHQRRFPSYVGVKRHMDFNNFDTFVAWAETKAGFMCKDDKGNSYQLDKDILGDGTEYSPNACCFVPPYINNTYGSLNVSFPKTKREFFRRVFTEDFETLDEDVLDKFFEICKEEAFLSKISKRDVEREILASKINGKLRDYDNMNELNNLMYGINFTNGFYHITMEGKFLGKFECPVEAVTFRMNQKLLLIDECVSKDIHGDILFNVDEIKSKILNFLESIKNGKIKFKKWVLVDMD